MRDRAVDHPLDADPGEDRHAFERPFQPGRDAIEIAGEQLVAGRPFRPAAAVAPGLARAGMLVDADQPGLLLLAVVARHVGIAHDRDLRVARQEFGNCVGDEVVMLHVGDRNLDADHPADLGHPLKEIDDRLVTPGERPQHRVVVGVGQTAHVEDEVGIHRDAVLEAEGFEQQRDLAARLEVHEALHPVAQGVGRQVAGIDALPQFCNLTQQASFLGDAGTDTIGDAICKRVRPAGLRESSRDRVITGIEEQDPAIQPP